eukprot:s1476_g14.t1
MLHGLRDSRAGYELTLAVAQAQKAKSQFRWECGLAQLADSLTKCNGRKAILQFLLRGNTGDWAHAFPADQFLQRKAFDHGVSNEYTSDAETNEEDAEAKKASRDFERKNKTESSSKAA